MDLIHRFFKEPGMSYFIFGPRGTGKSTWLKMRYKSNCLYLDLLSPQVFREYSARPEKLEQLVAGNSNIQKIIIDEIQKVPALLDVVHKVIENNREIEFVLTGSSSRKLKRGGVDLLSGRAANKTFHPFMASELGKKFILEDAIKFGLLPVVTGSESPAETINSYVSLYMNEEVKNEGLVRNIGDFNRFLEIISFSNGSILNTSEIARESQNGRKAVENYISILEDILLAFRIPVFSKRAKRHLVKHQKFYFFDAGVYRTIRPAGPLDSPQEIDGIALENLVFQNLIAWNAYKGNGNDIFYWRTKSGTEVDFILYGKDTFVAIEVKNSNKIRSQDLKPLKSFLTDYPQAEGLFLYRGTDKLQIDGINCISCEHFLRNLVPWKSIHSIINMNE